MTYTDMARDQLARHLYIHAHDDDGANEAWRDAGAAEWDSNDASLDDVQDCYAQADRILAGGDPESRVLGLR